MATGTDNTTVSRDSHHQMVHTLRKGITFADIDSTVTVGVLPIGAIVVGGGVLVSTAFNSATSDTVGIGTSADPNGIATLLAVSTAGLIVADELATSDDLGPYTAATTIVADQVSTGTAATAGSGEIYIQYICDNDG